MKFTLNKVYVKIFKILSGLIISIAFCYLTFKDTNFYNITQSFFKVKLFLLILSLLSFLFATVLRSFRIKIMLSHIHNISLKKMIPIYSVGLMAISIAPMRLGDLIKPFIISQNTNIPFSSSLSCCFMERILDFLSILFLLFIAIISIQLPAWFLNVSYSIYTIFILTFIFVIIFYFKIEPFLSSINKKGSKILIKIIPNIQSYITNIIEGLKIISSPIKLLFIIFLSILIWFLMGLGLFFIILSFDFNLTILHSIVILFVSVIGISLPSAPGFIGNFQYSCIVALSMFEIAKSDAIAFSLIFYLNSIILNIIVGLLFITKVEFSLNVLFDMIKNKILFRKNKEIP